MSLAKLMESMPNAVELGYASMESDGSDEETGMPIPKRISVSISFSLKGFGFGELLFIRAEDGTLILDSECTSKETVMKVLGMLVDGAIFDWDKDPVKHKKYNEIRGAICGDNCQICHPPEKGGENV